MTTLDNNAPFRLALAQSPAELEGVEARLGWLGEVLKGMAPADLLLLPESFASGYNRATQIPALAEAPDGPIAEHVAALTRQHGLAILYGYAERAGDRIFNAAQCIGPDGRALHRHRKLMLPLGFERDLYTPGAGCGVFHYRGLTLGTLICYDVEFPETARHLAKQGADLVLVPTALGANWPWVSEITAPARAYENRLYLAYANHAGAENGLIFHGGSVIAGPDGQEVARAGAAPEILYAEIDPARIAKARAQIPYVDHLREVALE